MADRIIPLGERLLIKPQEEEERTKGGIWIPATAMKDQPTSGEIIAVSDDCEEEWKVGQQVIFGRHAGARILLGERGERVFILLKESDVMGLLVQEVEAL